MAGLIYPTQRILYSGCFDNREVLDYLATWGAITAADNGGYLQCQGAGAHGLDATYAVGGKVILAGTNLPYGLYTILSRDSANNITVNVAYSAGIADVVACRPATVTVPAATFTSLSTASNGGYQQISSSGVHGLTAAGGAVGRSVFVAGTCFNGLFRIRSIDSTTAFTLDLPYSADRASPTMAVAGTGVLNHFPVAVVQVSKQEAIAGSVIEAEAYVTSVSSIGAKALALRTGVTGTALVTAANTGSNAGIANTVLDARYKLSLHVRHTNQFIAAGASAVPGYGFGTGTTAFQTPLHTPSSDDWVYYAVTVSIATANEWLQIPYCRISFIPPVD